MSGARLTPPSNQDGPFGYQAEDVDHFGKERRGEGRKLDGETARKLALEAYLASTNWVNSGRRARWNDSLRAFQSLHPSGSKYLSREWSYRSSLYRPRTRTMVRKGEAGTASAFFANEDVLDVKARNDDDPKAQASAEIHKALLQYRLTNTIPWFLTIVGARQDAEVMGICVAKAYWEYEERHLGTKQRPKVDSLSGMPTFDEKTGEPDMEDYDLYEKSLDRPWVDLIAPENIRFDPACDWRDPVNTSPYIIEVIPSYVQDVMARVDSGEWLPVSDSALRGAVDTSDDTTRRTREAGRVPGADRDSWRPAEFDICWVHSNIVKWDGRDWIFYTLSGSGQLLSDPVPLAEVHLHGQRPYVVGSLVVETHKVYPSGKVELVRDLQRIANDDLNLRFDAVKLSLQPRQFVKAGAGVELNDLRTFMPGKIVVLKGEKGEPVSTSVSWDRSPPPDQSAYTEQQANQLDWDDLTGAFTNSSVQASQWAQQSATGMHLMSGEASGLNEYELRVFSETFVQPLLNLLIKLETAYETDTTVLAIAGSKAKLFDRFGISEVSDELLQTSVQSVVNVGIGSTNPSLKLRSFAQAAQIIEQLFQNPIAAQGINFHEALKEVFANAGYKDGERFIKPGFDPAQAIQQQEQMKNGGKGAGPDQGPARIEAAKIQAQSRQGEAQARAQAEAQKMQLDLQKAQMQEQAETQRVQMQIEAQRQQLNVQAQTEAAQSVREHFHRLNEGIQQMQNSHQQVMAGQQQQGQSLQDLVRHMRAPRKVVRGKDGKVAGVEMG